MFVARARAKSDAQDDGEPNVFVVQHDFLAGADRDNLSYLGLGARAAIYVNLSSRLCPDLSALSAVLQRDGASLYLHPHRTARYGFLRLSLELAGLAYNFDTAVSLVDGNVQEFLAVAYQTGVIELHLSRESSDESLCCACSTSAFRSVVDRALAELTNAEHPASPAEHDAFAVGLRSALVEVTDSLDPAAAIPLTVTDSVPPFVALEVVI